MTPEVAQEAVEVHIHSNGWAEILTALGALATAGSALLVNWWRVRRKARREAAEE